MITYLISLHPRLPARRAGALGPADGAATRTAVGRALVPVRALGHELVHAHLGELLVEEHASWCAEDGRREDEHRPCVSLLVGLEEQQVDGAVDGFGRDRLEPVDFQIGVDVVEDVQAELVVPVD